MKPAAEEAVEAVDVAVALAAAVQKADRATGSRMENVLVGKTAEARLLRPNHSLKLTRYGMRCLAASGPVGYFPYAAKQRIPPRSA